MDHPDTPQPSTAVDNSTDEFWERLIALLERLAPEEEEQEDVAA